MRNRYVFPFVSVFLWTLIPFFSLAANDSPQTFTLDGQLYTGDRTSPLLDATAKIKVQILDPSKNCILYEEEQPVDTTNSGGHFSIQVGSVVGSIKRKTLDAGNTMQKVYQNSSAIAASGVSCSGSYSPVMGAIRYVRVIVTPTVGSPNTLSPDMVMDAVPNAMVAQSVQGLERENILQFNPAANVTQSKLEQFFMSLTSGVGSAVKYDGTNFVAYDPTNGGLLSTNSVNDAAIGSVGWAKITSVPATLAQIAGLSCPDGQIIKKVSGAWACASESGVGVESDPTVAAYAKNAPGTGLAVSGGAIVADFGTGAGKVVQGNDSRLSDSRAPNGSAGGDLSGSYPSPTVAKIQGRGVSVTAPADGQVLRYDNGASSWVPVNFGIDDLKTSIGGSQFISASCTSAQTLIWSAVTDTFSCTNIGISGSQVSGNIAGLAANVTGTVAVANGGTGATTASGALNALLPSQTGHGGKVLQTDGASASWQTPAAGGITSFNGSSQSSQTLAAPGVTGAAPNWSTNTGTGAHTLNIPMASTAGVTAGLISKTDYDNFNSKLGSESDPKVGANSANYLSKWNGSALVASGVYDNGSGNVGIGTASPSQSLQIGASTPAATTTPNAISLGGTYSSVAGANPKLRLYDDGSLVYGIGVSNGSMDFMVPSGTTTFNWYINASNKMTIANSGNVGIGTTNPGTKLDVNGTINATAMTINGVPVSAGGGDNLGNHTATQNLNLGAFKLVGNGGSNGLVITNSGNVGVGVASPGEALQVNGAVKATGTSGTLMPSSTVVDNIFGTTARLISVGPNPSTAGGFEFNAASSDNSINTNPMVILPNGRVGIGSASPSGKLDVNGTINATAINIGGVALGTSLSGDVSGAFSATTVDKIKGIAVSATPTLAGQVLRYTGSQFTPAFISMADLRSQTTGTTSLATSCAANQTLTYNSVGDNLTCSNISLPAGQVTGTLGIANGGTGQTTANAALNALLPSQSSQATKFLQTDGTNTSWASVSFTETDPKVGANTTNYLSKWNGSALVASGLIELAGGSVGIGTSNPLTRLHVGKVAGVATSSVGDHVNGSTDGQSGINQTAYSDGNNYLDYKTFTGGYSYFRTGQGTESGAQRIWMSVQASNGNVGINTMTPALKLSVAGEVQVGSTSAACNSTNAGALQYASGTMQMCNGSAWIVVAGAWNVSPAGAISAFPMATCPAGWLEANGAAVSRTTYSGLFTAIATNYGAGDGSTTFNLPDYRGYFLRGWDHGAGNDPDSATRTTRGDGTTGDSVGTKQVDQLKSHSHTIRFTRTPASSGSAGGTPYDNGYSSATANYVGGFTADATGGNQTNPKNINVTYCVSTALAPTLTTASTGSGTTNYIPQWTGSTALGDSPISVSAGNVGIGSALPGQKLTVAGMIESTSGGVKFPDGSIQTTSASSSTLPSCPIGDTLVRGVSSWLCGSSLNTSLIATMTSNTAPSPLVATAGDNAAGAWSAFDNNTTSFWGGGGLSANSWLSIDLGSQKLIKSYTLTARNDGTGATRMPNAWNLYGSNDGSSYTLIENKTTTNWGANESRSFSLSMLAYYRYFKILATSCENSANVQIASWQLVGGNP